MLAGLALWLVYVGLVSGLGPARNQPERPPGAAFLLLPVFAFVLPVVARPAAALRVASAVPIPVLLGAQVFRVGVELLLHRLWLDGLVPRMLTFEGANLDIAVGVSAPLAAWLPTRGDGACGWPCCRTCSGCWRSRTSRRVRRSPRQGR